AALSPSAPTTIHYPLSTALAPCNPHPSFRIQSTETNLLRLPFIGSGPCSELFIASPINRCYHGHGPLPLRPLRFSFDKQPETHGPNCREFRTDQRVHTRRCSTERAPTGGHPACCRHQDGRSGAHPGGGR